MYQSMNQLEKSSDRAQLILQQKNSIVSRRPFFSGDGFDFYVDRSCGMPYNCTVSKAVLRIIGARQQVQICPSFSSYAFIPR